MLVSSSKSLFLAGALLVLSLPAFAAAAPEMRLNGSHVVPLQANGAPAIHYRLDPEGYTAEVELQGYLFCNEFATPGNNANTSLRLRPLHGMWVVGEGRDDSFNLGGSIYDLQRSYSRVHDFSYAQGRFDVAACDARGDGAGCTAGGENAAMQCLMADAQGRFTGTTKPIFSSGFDEYSNSGNSWVRVAVLHWPVDADDDILFKVDYHVPTAPLSGGAGPNSLPSSHYILQVGYDQDVLRSCVHDSTKITASGSVTHGCKLRNPNVIQDATRPIFTAALFTAPDALERDYADNIAFAHLHDPGPSAQLVVNVYGEGMVTAATPPTPISGDIFACNEQSAGQGNCRASYALGSQVTLQATATTGSGSVFQEWLGACSDATSVQAMLLMDADKNCAARFQAQAYQVTASAPDGGGAITPALQSVSHGDAATFQVTPDSNNHYEVGGVTGDTCAPQDNGDGTWTAANIQMACAVTASFVKKTYTLTYTVNYADRGELSGATVQQVQHGSDGTPVTAVPKPGYAFVLWSPSGSTDITRTDLNVQGPIDEMAIFNPDTSTYTIGGTLSGLAGGATVQLLNNGGDLLFVQADGTFTFATPLANGASYNVTVSQHPIDPVQTCTVTDGSGTVSGANVTNIAVSCAATEHQVEGFVVSGEGVITPDGPQSVPDGGSRSFDIVATAPYQVPQDAQSNGFSTSCTGTYTFVDWTHAQYAVGPVTADCSFDVAFTNPFGGI